MHCVLSTLSRSLLKRDYYVLKFNSRGVGQSGGWSSLTGMSESKDLEALVLWALNNIEDVADVVFIGYSHGALITSLHPTLPAPLNTRHILISYPLGVRGLITLFRTGSYAASLSALLHDPTSNVLVVYGTQDEFTSEQSYNSWAGKLCTEVGDGTGRLEVHKVEDANHFWAGAARQELVRAVEGWLP
ncbi:hypothetical protein HWV62_2318 [Athelia sp. TMB]|nr:hypothetical protein HWV62_2318 [Athelia sp. TMB]